MVGHKAGSVCNPEPTVFTLGAGDGGDRRMRFFRTWLQGMNAKRRYASYDEYLAHQKTKTLDPIRREKWLGEEWRSPSGSPGAISRIHRAEAFLRRPPIGRAP